MVGESADYMPPAQAKLRRCIVATSVGQTGEWARDNRARPPSGAAALRRPPCWAGGWRFGELRSGPRGLRRERGWQYLGSADALPPASLEWIELAEELSKAVDPTPKRLELLREGITGYDYYMPFGRSVGDG